MVSLFISRERRYYVDPSPLTQFDGVVDFFLVLRGEERWMEGRQKMEETAFIQDDHLFFIGYRVSLIEISTDRGSRLQSPLLGDEDRPRSLSILLHG